MSAARLFGLILVLALLAMPAWSRETFSPRRPVPETSAPTLAATPQKMGGVIQAANCSQAAVQLAINQAQDGSTVIIPNGTCTWQNEVDVTKQVTLQGQTKGGVKLVMGSGIDSWDTPMIHVTTGTSYSTEISHLQFWPGGGVGMYLLVDGSVTDKPPLIHDNSFNSTDAGQLFEFISYRRYGGGVIYRNTFQSTYNGNTQWFGSGGIQVKDGYGDASWAAPSTLGMNDATGLNNLYIEDNTFTNVGTFDSDDGSRIVFRHNVLNNAPMASHGADTSWIGMRHIEIYDNQMIFNSSGTWALYDINGHPVTGSYPLNLVRWYDFRGGTGVITGNSVPDIISQDWGDKSELTFQIQQSDRNAGPDACASTYPAYHQVGRGMNNTLEPVYVWGNTGTGKMENPSVENSGYRECPNNPNQDNPGYYIQPNRDYYAGIPKPGWTRYPYPHPLRNEGVPNITTTSLPTGAVGRAYSQTLDAIGGTAPYTWTLAGGSLPAGLALFSAGLIGGVPTTATTQAFTVQVADSREVTDTQVLSLTVITVSAVVFLPLVLK